MPRPHPTVARARASQLVAAARDARVRRLDRCVLTEHGEHFDYVELWNAPNALWSWDARLDPDLALFAATVGNAARWVRERGKKTVLGGLRPADPTFLARLAQHGELQHFDAIGIHAQPDLSEPDWPGWKPLVARIRTALEQLGRPRTEVWITEGGYSTWRHDEGRQVREFLDATDAGADRLYWSGMFDLPIDVPTSHGLHVDQREYHLGMRRADGEPKLLYRLWSEGGLENVRSHEFLVRPPVHRRSSRKTTVITGGAGFIGSNVANALLAQGEEVVLLDNLSRGGIERNVRWLRETHGSRVQLALADIRDPFVVRDVVERADRVFHFAAQVAVTLSLVSPRHDFDVNAAGTLNLLEAMRSLKSPPPLVFTSTNKVYGGLPDVVLQRNGSRYEPVDPGVRAHGIDEQRPLDFHSPYGCSKGVADQYIIDYSRCFDLPTVVFRMSCIYGPRQFGNEEQGWVAHFVKQALADEPITIYGDGMQVRDVLFVGDLVEAFKLAVDRIDDVRGQAFNVGGGPENTVSLIELLETIGAAIGRPPRTSFGPWRPGDQRYYVTDYRKLQKATGWRPVTTVEEGVAQLRDWLSPAPSKRTTVRTTGLAKGSA